MISPKEYIQTCTDNELFQLLNSASSEITTRLINLLKSHNCTTVFISKEKNVNVCVNNIYGMHEWDSETFEKWITLSEIGYHTWLDNDKTPIDYLYIVSDTSEQFTNEEISEDTLWDLYKATKEIFEN